MRLSALRCLVASCVLLFSFACTVPQNLSAQSFRERIISHPDTLRKLFLTSSDRFRLLLEENLATAGMNRLRPVRLLTRDDLVARLDSTFQNLYGVPFLKNSVFADAIIDSLRLQFYEAPDDFDEDRMDHLEAASRTTSGRPFVRANSKLAGMLRIDREDYFDRPESYSLTRLFDLERISMHVTALPFLRGSPLLVAKLHGARLNHEQTPGRFSEQRISELNEVSLRVTGVPFLETRDYRTIIAVGATGVSLIALLLWVTFGRTEPATETASAEPKKTVMSPAEACLILGVEPDTDLQTLSRAYREQQKRYHPDLVAHLGSEFIAMAEERTRSINQAYELLRGRLDPNPGA